MKASVTTAGPKVLVSKTSRRLLIREVALGMIPALLIKMSRRPCCFSTNSAAVVIDSWSVTSI